ncbi:helix-turn-helix domain-containing protein [Saccharothrix sp. AJ9571]|nr:helix-turn-helix domain-containing protein [Saccharothrix sp. AJ9571]
MSGVPVDPEFDKPLREALGLRLRLLRRGQGLDRESVCAQLHNGMAIGTLGAYESGARRLTVSRFIELCDVLGTPAHEVLAMVHRDLQRQSGSRLSIRLKVIAEVPDAELRPLREWAIARVAAIPPTVDRSVELDAHSIGHLAALCDVPPEQLRVQLRYLAVGAGHDGIE